MFVTSWIGIPEALNEAGDMSVTDLLPYMSKKIDEFKGAADQFDDITMLAFVYKEIRGLNLLFVVSATYWQNHFEIMPI